MDAPFEEQSPSLSHIMPDDNCRKGILPRRIGSKRMLPQVNRWWGIEPKGRSIYQVFTHILRSIAHGYSHILYRFTVESESCRCIEQVLDGLFTFGSTGQCCTQAASRTI